MYIPKLALVCLLLTATVSIHAQDNVLISEFMASNSKTLVDENGEFSDWIEISNTGAVPVDLGGWYLTDESANLTKWQFPSTNLNAGGFLVVFASNKDRRIAGAPLHTNFRLSTGGEYLALVKPDGSNIVSQFAPTFPPQAADVSYGYGVLTTNLTLISSNSAVHVQVPANGADGTDWTSVGYDDSTWLLGTNGVGFGSTNVTQADYGAAVAQTVPLGFWRFSESSGTTAVNSGSGANLNGTYNAVTLGTPGPQPPAFTGFEPNNTAPTFNGTSSYVSANSSILNNSAAFTIAGWVKGAAVPGSRIGLFGQNDCVEFGFINPTTLECWTPGGGALDAAYSLPVNTWHHIAAVGNGLNLRIFVDGAQIGQGGVSTASYGSSTFPFNIGGGGIFDALPTGNNFNGQIDEVVAYQRALSTNEILSLYQAGTNAFGVSVLPYVNTDIGAAMSNVNATAYVRLPFVIGDPANVALLTLRMRYDDGFVAYLNGTEVVRVNAPATPVYNSAATNTHSALVVDQFRLGPGLLQAGANVLAIQALNASAADADFLIAAELVQTSVAQSSPNPVYMTVPTPGAPNSAGVAMPGPAFSNPSHTPNLPLDSQDVTVAITVTPTFRPVSAVSLRYRIMFGPEVEVQMLDDGLHGDAAAADGIWGAVIPQSASTNGQMIRWSFRASDIDGNVSRWPLFANSSGPEYLGTIVDPTNSVTSPLPIFHLFVDPAQQGAVDSQGGGPASLFHIDEFYDNINMQVRGNSTVGYLKKSHRLEFNKEHLLKFDGPGGRLQKTSFVADYPDPSYMRQGLSFWLCDQIGAPGPFYIPSRLQLNAQFYQLANHNDVHGDELLGRLGYDPNGALYNAAGTVEASKFSTGGFEKKTRKWDVGDVDYLQLANAIVETLPVGTRKTNIFDLLDLPEVINYLVAARFVQENDDVWANMSLYHDNDGDRLWRIIPFDMNLSWGAYFSESVAPIGIQANNDDHKGFPLYGSSQALAVGSGNFNRIYDVIFTVPETRDMFLRRMRTVLDAYIRPIGTPPGATTIETRALALRDLMLADADLDRARWGWPAVGGQGNLPPGTNLTFGVSDLIEKFFYVRRGHFYGRHSVTNTALPIGISKTQNAGIPLPQPPSTTIQISGFDFNPSSANQNQEYIQLTNPNPWAVELSGWRLDGAVQFTFKQGTVMPSNSVMYVSPDVVAFRARSTGPRGGQGLFVQGNYKGQLSARGEGVVLYDNFGRFMHTNGYAGNPSAAQQFLRITEIMYHSADTNENLEYIELKNIGPAPLSLTGVRFTNGINFNFTGSAVTTLAAGARVLVVKNLAAFTAQYGSGLPIAGQYAGTLENRGETLRLEDSVGEKILEFAYDNSWYPITDGLGFSLVIVDDTAPWDSWTRKESWRPSAQLAGSPGINEPVRPILAPILINEALTRSDTPPPTDTIELYNPTGSSVDIGGWFLTDDFNTPKKFRIPTGTSIPAGGYLSFDESQFNPTPGVGLSFALSSDGDEVYLFSGDANTNLTGYVHGFTFGAAEDGVSFGRYVTSLGAEHFVRQATPTLGAANAGPAVGPVVITEIMYHPPDSAAGDNSLDEYIELYNSSGSVVPLYDPQAPTNTWQIKGGVDFVFPANVTLNPGGFALIVNFNPDSDTATAAAFRTKYGVPGAVPLFGPYKGKLDNSGQSVEVKKPTTPIGGKIPYVLIDKVDYRDAAPWPAGADGAGLSLHRKSVTQYGDDPANWVAASPNAGQAYSGIGTAPSITLGPGTQTVVVGTDGSLSVTATGDGPLGYQWRFNRVNIPGASAATLTVPNFQIENSGEYDVVVYNSVGSEISLPARVDSFYPVTLFAQPQPRTVRIATVNTVAATNVSFSVFALSSGPITYQWRFNGVTIPGATNSTLSFNTISITNNGTVQAIVTDSVRSVPSDIANLSVIVLPTFTVLLPAASTVVQGDNVTYNVSIAGFPPPFTYSWRKGLTVLTNIITPSTNSTFTLFNVQTNDAAQYRVVVTNLANSTIASFNNLTVLLDTDGDHIPDTWETQFGFNPRDKTDGLADPDQDGATNLQEYQSGTNPTNAQSAFKFTSIVVSGNTNTMRFQAVSNRTYSVQYKSDLNSLTWVNLTNVASATTNRPAIIIRDTGTTAGRIYRVGTP